MRDVRWCVTVDYQEIENGNLANQIYFPAVLWARVPRYTEEDRTPETAGFC